MADLLFFALFYYGTTNIISRGKICGPLRETWAPALVAVPFRLTCACWRILWAGDNTRTEKALREASLACSAWITSLLNCTMCTGWWVGLAYSLMGWGYCDCCIIDAFFASAVSFLGHGLDERLHKSD